MYETEPSPPIVAVHDPFAGAVQSLAHAAYNGVLAVNVVFAGNVPSAVIRRVPLPPFADTSDCLAV